MYYVIYSDYYSHTSRSFSSSLLGVAYWFIITHVVVDVRLGPIFAANKNILVRLKVFV